MEFHFTKTKINCNPLFFNYSMDLNPTVRHTLWSQLVGGVFYWTQTNAVSQNMIQRYLALPTLSSARKALALFCLGVLVLMGLCSYNGLLMYATYKQCDPLTTKVGVSVYGKLSRRQILQCFGFPAVGQGQRSTVAAVRYGNFGRISRFDGPLHRRCVQCSLEFFVHLSELHVRRGVGGFH